MNTTILPRTLSRRQFIGALSVAVPGLCWAGDPSKGAPSLRMGVMSDSHVTTNPATLEPLRRAFAYMAAQNVDIVLHAGDICDRGTMDELELVMQTWHACFRNGRNAAGGEVVPFFVFGNHDYRPGSPSDTSEERARLICRNKDAAWRLICGESFPGEVFARTVKGFTFVGTHWRHEGDIADWFKAHVPAADRPVFHVRHPHPWHTCFGDWAPCEKAGWAELMRHPNLFAISGHSHISVGDNRSIWQGGFVSMGAGSSSCPSHGRRKEYENGNPKQPWPEGEFRHMPAAASGDGWQVSIIEVRPDDVTVIRRELHHDESLGEDWHVPFPFRHDAQHPYLLADAAAAPEFPPAAQIRVREVKGKRRPDGLQERQFRVLAPAAHGTTPHARALAYHFTVLEAATGRKVLERYTLQDGITVSEARACQRPCWCAFAWTDLPENVSLKVRIEPLNASWRAGRPIESAPFVRPSES